MNSSQTMNPGALTGVAIDAISFDEVPESASPVPMSQRGSDGHDYMSHRVSPAFAKVLLDQAAAMFLGGEPEAARWILHDLVKATVGYVSLAEQVNKPVKSLRRMLSPGGNPGMDSLSTIFSVIRDWLKVTFDVRVVEAA